MSSSQENRILNQDEIESLFQKIQSNRLECDLLISLFNVSATSSRKYHVCEPFPGFLKNKSAKNFEQIDSFFNELPSLSQLDTIDITHMFTRNTNGRSFL
ncbi:hypothetical protein PPL_02032 [Heterostelium album PN500]|uniref:PARP16 N-terminal domain-containing protein n=1 Tax=Heterostelium pallidum (strain ATCC 26659 / Pp 5 / PN500) TaxID=670386 RepID=D3B162_HETP5|nr:hypothetical protein PPL_02032 [Heterostelium album PN500]EFA85036.1 hypothetical protein PPL_02032 [Heterostelium album PN500]|eukprot:XP_020437146.1 hypothetical protein PPL_02032 [Heterostelium album PN500]